MIFEKDRWVRCIGDPGNYWHPTEDRLLRLGELVLVTEVVHDGQGDPLGFYKNQKYGKLSLFPTDFEPWIPAEDEQVEVVENVCGAHKTINAMEETFLQPGDVIKVSSIKEKCNIRNDSTGEAVPGPFIQYSFPYHSHSDYNWIPLRHVRPLGVGVSAVKTDCSCDMTTLMRAGCACGAIPKYQEPSLLD